MIDGVGGTTTSSAYDISRRQLVTVQFIASEQSVFTIDVSNDGSHWITSVAFLDSKATTGGGTFVTSKTVTAAASEGAIITPGFRYIRVVSTPAGGTGTAILQAAG